MGRTPNILWAEDNPQDQVLIRYALEECEEPPEVVFVQDGADLLARLREEEPDLLVLDLKMPRIDGREVLLELDAEGMMDRLPVVVFTSTDRPCEVEECRQLGVRAYLQKPMDFVGFLGAVRAILAHVPDQRHVELSR